MAAPTRVFGTGPELTLSPDHYRAVAESLQRLSGIRLGPSKKALVIARLSPRVRATGLATMPAYLDALLAGALPDETPHFVDALTTNKSGFFRESAHFDHLTRHHFPHLAGGNRPLRFWSAGCATGEEPYTLAMLVRDSLPLEAQRRVRILATDISHRSLATARAASYSPTQCQDIPAGHLERHFERSVDGDARRRVASAVAELVSFAWLNLVDEWPITGPFDLILCRNVMIYFDRATQERLVKRLGALLRPGGILCVGHAESLTGNAHGLEQVQPAVYRRGDGAA